MALNRSSLFAFPHAPYILFSKKHSFWLQVLRCKRKKSRKQKLVQNCSRNESNYAGHIWDKKDSKDGGMGAKACIVVNAFIPYYERTKNWTALTWWVHDRFVAFNKWVFTIGDADCFPSVPHGHLHKKTNPRPKLNPYTGRVFWDAHNENVSMRLTRAEMKSLWSDSSFVEHCREQVIHYTEFAPGYGFPNARRGKLHFPRWK